MIRALLFLVTLASIVHAGEETPMQYLIHCLGVKKEGGKVIDSRSKAGRHAAKETIVAALYERRCP